MASLGEITTKARGLSNINTIVQLCYLLKIQQKHLLKIVEEKGYNEFFIRKPRGGKRLIEDPTDSLQLVQEDLNEYLQCLYFQQRSRSAYGFQLAVGNETKARNIKTNAMVHLGKLYLLNADFKDFFHQVSIENVKEIFSAKPFSFSPEVVELVAELVTYKGRLPMGAPTSPVLSNFATLKLDNDLEDFADYHALAYTRFADDLTFSSLKPITPAHFREIEQIAMLNGFVFNPNKVSYLGPNDTKIITGIVLGDELGLEKPYLLKVKQEIERFRIAKEMSLANGTETNDFLNKFSEQLRGQLQFIGFVYGKSHPVFLELETAYRAAVELKSYEIVNWMDFNTYSFFTSKKKK